MRFTHHFGSPNARVFLGCMKIPTSGFPRLSLKSPFPKGGFRGIIKGFIIPPDPSLKKGGIKTKALTRVSCKILFLALVAGLLTFPAAIPAQACTLFAAAGSRVEGGGTIIAKNRDRRPRQSALKVFAPPDGFKHLALAAVDNPKDPVVAGVNEKGLVVVDASPSTLLAKEEVCGAVGLTQALLSRCASVDEVLARRDLLDSSYPVFQMVADPRKIAVIEIAPRGRVAVKVSDQGALGHTNHYLDSQLLEANRKANSSSKIRYRRIGQLLSRQARPFTLADFLAFSQDRHDGPDNSICRTGSVPTKIRTLATWIVAQPADGVPSLFVRIANPGERPKMINLRLEPALWSKGLNDKILLMVGGQQTSPIIPFSCRGAPMCAPKAGGHAGPPLQFDAFERENGISH